MEFNSNDIFIKQDIKNEYKFVYKKLESILKNSTTKQQNTFNNNEWIITFYKKEEKIFVTIRKNNKNNKTVYLNKYNEWIDSDFDDINVYAENIVIRRHYFYD